MTKIKVIFYTLVLWKPKYKIINKIQSNSHLIKTVLIVTLKLSFIFNDQKCFLPIETASFSCISHV